jgi:dihydroorotate dehydrogenase electron transfer subunit
MTTKYKIGLELKRRVAETPETMLLTYAAPREVVEACRPGQFFNLRPLESTAPLLRRPVSVCDARVDAGEIDLLVRVVGEGTRLIASQMPGARLDAIGPLGRPFTVDLERPAIMIGGGVGIAPVYYLAQWMRRMGSDSRVTFCYGARSSRDFCLLKEIESVVSALATTTEDGTHGRMGYVTEAAGPYLTDDRQIFVCGPSPMMQAVLVMMRERGLEGQFSLENQMGCGVGACQGCVVPGRSGMIRVCCDGPVVDSQELDAILCD